MPELTPTTASEEPTLDKTKVNDFQRAVARTYGGGDYAHFAEIENYAELRKELDGCGDTNFVGIMVELSSNEDCHTWEEAKNRVESLRRDLDEAMAALEAAEESLAPTSGPSAGR